MRRRANAHAWATDIDSSRPILDTAPDVPQRTFVDVLHDAVSARPDHVQYVLPHGTQYTVEQFYDLSVAVAKALVALAVAPRDAVCIMGANSVHWFAADVAATLAAAVPVGVYATNKPDVVAYIADHCGARVFFVDAEPALDKVLSVLESCPRVTAVVCWGTFDEAAYAARDARVLSWQRFLELGAPVMDEQLAERTALATPTGVCKLVYTSGTTGPPKAVMLSHDNITFTLAAVERVIAPTTHDRMVSYLPASHIAANLTDIACALHAGVTMTLADADALVGSLVHTLRRTRPTILTAVPRVYEKIMESMLAAAADAGVVARTVSAFAKRVGNAAADLRDAGDGDATPWGYALADTLVFSKVKRALGLDDCRLLINTAAPLQRGTMAFFRSLDFQIHDMYGMSEGTGPLTFNYPDFRAGTSGKPMPGVEVEVRDAHGTVEGEVGGDGGEGELCFRGRNVFVGYLGDAAASRTALGDDGFIRSGDLGRVDDDGFVTVTGRAKELLVTAGGENVAPLLVETTLLGAMPAISRAFALGDARKFVAAVLIPHMDEAGTLIGPAAEVNRAVRTAAAARSDDVWQRYLAEGVARANENAVSKAATVRSFELLDADFSVETGELTPTMKVKRNFVVSKLGAVISRLYGE